MNKLKLEALASSILVYLIIIVTIFTIALYNPTKERAKNYTEKNSEVIEVSLGTPSNQKNYLNKKSVKKQSSKKVKKPIKKAKKKVVKKVRNVKPKIVKKAVKKSKKTAKKVVKKTHKKIDTKVAKKSVNASSLFKNLPKNIKSEVSSKPVGNSGKSLKKVNNSKGIVNSYFARVQNTLKSWPAQSNFAGEVIRVKLVIYSTGLFDYKIISRSLNPEFNRALKAYLEQLKRVGFGAHSNPKPYNIVVEFIAK